MTKVTEAGQRAIEVRKAVQDLLERHPESRDDDRILMVLYWQEVDGLRFDYTFPTTFIESGTSPESITRARRAIQSVGLFPATDAAVMKRRMRQAELQAHYTPET
jgi:hypothetical protein